MLKSAKLITCFLAVTLMLTGCSCGNKKVNKNDEKNKAKQETKILEDAKVDGLKISGFNITFKDGMSTIVATVTNETKEEIKLSSLSLLLYDKNNKLIIETIGNIGDSIKPGEEKQFNTLITMDVRKTEKVEYKINK